MSLSLGRRRWATIASAVFGLAGVWVLGWPDPAPELGFRLDDAWIHMVYGRSLADAGVLAYNPGVPATGATSPLWAFALALAHLLLGWHSVDAIVAGVYLMGGALHALTALLAGELARDLGQSDRVGLLAGVLVALSPPLSAAAFSGMEVPLTSALVVGALVAVVRDRMVLCGWAVALAALTRPEAAVVGVVVFAFVLLSPGREGRRLTWLAGPSVLLGGAWMAYNLWASGSLLPATFHMKSELAGMALPSRLAVGAWGIVGQVPPFLGGVGWLAYVGLVRLRTSPRGVATLLPVAVGLSLLLANLVLIPPVDPDAFYHVRYLLPATSALLVGAVVGADLLGRGLSPRVSGVPLLVLVAVGVGGIAFSVLPESRGLHNDTRNINELQRRIGHWMKANTLEGAWIATNDAGAVRYFADRPTIDLMGLNTPEVRWIGAAWTRERPVHAVALMPSWFRPVELDAVHVLESFETEGYTVTSDPAMATQVVLGCRGVDTEPRSLPLTGIVNVEVHCLSWRRP